MRWKKPSGLEIETNDDKETVEYCESLGWERVKETKKKGKETSASASGATTWDA